MEAHSSQCWEQLFGMTASLAGQCLGALTSWPHSCILPWHHYTFPDFFSCLIKQLGFCVTDTSTFQTQSSGRALHAQAVFLIKPFSYCTLPKSKLGCKRLNRCNTFTPDDDREPLYPPNRWADLLASKFGMTNKVYHVKPDAISTLQFCKNALVLQKAITEMCEENMRSEPLPAPAFCSWHIFPQSGEKPNVEACFWNDFKDEIWCLLCPHVSSAGKLQSSRRGKMRATVGQKMNLL